MLYVRNNCGATTVIRKYDSIPHGVLLGRGALRKLRRTLRCAAIAVPDSRPHSMLSFRWDLDVCIHMRLFGCLGKVSGCPVVV